MRTIIRRLQRLEEQLGPSVETEFDRQLRTRIEAGRRRLQEQLGEPAAAVRYDWLSKPRPVRGPGDTRSLVEILSAGRERARLRARDTAQDR